MENEPNLKLMECQIRLLDHAVAELQAENEIRKSECDLLIASNKSLSMTLYELSSTIDGLQETMDRNSVY